MKPRAFAVITGLILAIAMPSVADAYRTVTTGNVNLRSGAGTDNARLATLPRGTGVWVAGCRLGWCLVRTLGRSGWVAGRYLGGPGLAGRNDPPVAHMPPVVASPPVVPFNLVVPRNYHDFGSSRYHEPNRKFHP